MPSDKTVVLVTGANQGIGLAVAKSLAQNHGYHIVIGSRQAAAGEAVAASLVQGGFSASSVQLDVTSDESIAAATKSIEENFGVLDVLINNAGVLLDYGAGGKEANRDLRPRDLFTQTFATNVIGVACLTEACIPLLRKSKHGRLIFVSSIMGSLHFAQDKTTPYYPIDYKAYDSSKAALNMLALNYVRNLEADKILVNVVCPGLVKTNLTNHIAYGSSTDEGAKRIVELATSTENGLNGTFSNKSGSIPW